MKIMMVIIMTLTLSGCFKGGTINTTLDIAGDVIDVVVPF